ncbi:MAG: pilus assembly protein PilP [Gammaproteobacteria bacterium]|nr:pilus assembly protein PilP [Gammaproteobacteria bacterium]
MELSRKIQKIVLTTAVVVLSLSTSACLTKSNDDLVAFIDQVNSRPGGRIEPMPEFKPYEAFPYTGSGERNPFMLEEGESFLTAEADKPDQDSGLKPDITRRKEVLEQYPLDALKHVGVLEKSGELWGIIVAPDGLVHKVSVGDYMGQNHGKIFNISETRVELIELAKNPRGKWVERQAAISLLE